MFLNNLPSELKELVCNNNKITSLDNLPLGIEILNCYENPLIYKFYLNIENIIEYNKKI